KLVAPRRRQLADLGEHEGLREIYGGVVGGRGRGICVERGEPDAGARAARRLQSRVQVLLRDLVPAVRHLVVRSLGGIRDVGVLLCTAGAQPDRGDNGHEEERQSPDEASCSAEGPVRQRVTSTVCRLIQYAAPYRFGIGDQGTERARVTVMPAMTVTGRRAR